MIDYDSVTSRVRTFDEKHGDFVVFDNWIYFQDGGIRELNPFGPLMEPPTNPIECQKKIVWFWEKKLELAVEEFSVTKRSMLAFVRAFDPRFSVPRPSPERLQLLKNLKKKVVAANTCLDLAKLKLRELQPEVERGEKQRAEEMQRLAEYEKQIQEIEV